LLRGLAVLGVKGFGSEFRFWVLVPSTRHA
jgi:hypothetical protein